MSNNGHFNDEYDLKEELGKGAFSTVRRCVKVKILRLYPYNTHIRPTRYIYMIS